MRSASPVPAIVLCTLNARYIHASLGLRYLLANMARHGGQDLRDATVLREYTLARPVEQVVADLIATLRPVDASEPSVDTLTKPSRSQGASEFCAGKGGDRAAGGGHGAKQPALARGGRQKHALPLHGRMRNTETPEWHDCN